MRVLLQTERADEALQAYAERWTQDGRDTSALFRGIAVALLREGLRSADGLIRTRAGAALAAWHAPDLWPVFREALAHPEASIRALGAEGLGKLLRGRGGSAPPGGPRRPGARGAGGRCGRAGRATRSGHAGGVARGSGRPRPVGPDARRGGPGAERRPRGQPAVDGAARRSERFHPHASDRGFGASRSTRHGLGRAPTAPRPQSVCPDLCRRGPGAPGGAGGAPPTPGSPGRSAPHGGPVRRGGAVESGRRRGLRASGESPWHPERTYPSACTPPGRWRGSGTHKAGPSWRSCCDIRMRRCGCRPCGPWGNSGTHREFPV